jgi:hypothetical protein
MVFSVTLRRQWAAYWIERVPGTSFGWPKRLRAASPDSMQSKIASGHIPVKGLLHLFGEDLSKLVNLTGDRGVTVEGDNIILYPDRMLPPPRMDGKVTAVGIQGSNVNRLITGTTQTNL